MNDTLTYTVRIAGDHLIPVVFRVMPDGLIARPEYPDRWRERMRSTGISTWHVETEVRAYQKGYNDAVVTHNKDRYVATY